MTDSISQNEFSVEVDLASLPSGGRVFQMTLSKEECVRVAKRLNVVSVIACEGEIKLTLEKATITGEGSVRAELIRECVSSLEEMSEAINESFEFEFLREGAIRTWDESLGEDGHSEVHEGDNFDVGELLIQQVSLAMAPFPRKIGARSLAEEFGAETEASPFAVLQQRFKKNDKNH